MSPRFKEYLFYISAVLLLLSAALFLTGWTFIPYVYAVACSGIAVVYLTSPYEGKNVRLKRLRFMEIAAGLLLPASSFFMFKQKNEWFLCLFISAVLQLYSVIVKDQEMKKEKDEEMKKEE